MADMLNNDESILNFQGELTDNQEIIEAIDVEDEKSYLKELKQKHKGFLIDGLTMLEKERIAQFIIDRYHEDLPKHNELCDKLDEYDKVYRMQRKELQGSDGNMPNYRSAISTVTVDVVHANIMNVLFSPKDLLRVLPTEEGDVDKVKKLAVFGNWSIVNELNIFENCDRLFHSSNKNGEAPYMVHWVKEFGTEIEHEVVRDPMDPSKPLYDPDTKEIVYREKKKPKLLYSGPKLEVFSRKDYIQPKSATMNKTPPHEMRRLRITYDEYLRDMLQGKMYPDTLSEITGWSQAGGQDTKMLDTDGDSIPVGKWEQEFIEFYGRMRIKVIKEGADDEEAVELEELEDEFIALLHLESQTLCQLRENKFPLKMRPIGLDYMLPDDEGRRSASGVIEFMDGIQKAYDVFFNQYIYGITQANNPIFFFTPFGNQRDEPIKLQHGFGYPTQDPNSVKLFTFPSPDNHITLILQLINQWAQLLFGISDFTSGIESRIDPTGPAKKAEIVVAQGNVRLNAIIKRKNKTLKDIFKRWFLLYKMNMPPNKFMRIAGEAPENPWKFEAINLTDFQLNSLPDFELTGNILNSNKSLEANKAISIYQLFVQNPFFSPQSATGLQALNQLTKWLADKLDETGLSRFVPGVPGQMVHTPEEENARFMQGDTGEPVQNEDHVDHILKHRGLLVDQNIPDGVKQVVVQHIQEHVKMLQQLTTQQMVLGNQGGINGGQAGGGVAPGAPGGVVEPEPAGMAGFQG